MTKALRSFGGELGGAHFAGDFTKQEGLDEDAVQAAVSVLRSGRLHRYNTDGEASSETALLEAEYAAYQGASYCLACASGGAAMQIALRAAGVAQGAPVLTNAWTLAPVPGAIAAVGATPVLVETTDELVIDLDDLARKAAGSEARALLLSNMRGHLADMDAVQQIARAHDLILIEDCAHTMGAKWDGVMSGSFGLAGCFSTQTYKHMNSGEGGLLTSDDAAFMARAIILSGSYMLYERHGAAPPREAFEQIRLETPNCSSRMDNLRAAILRPQLQRLEENIQRWNARYRVVENRLQGTSGLSLRRRPQEERFVGSSLQFRLPGIAPAEAETFLAMAKSRGVELKWFGRAEPVGFTSAHQSWTYMPAQTLPQTDEVLAGLFDMRLPLSFSLDDCEQIGEIVADCVGQLRASEPR